MIENKTKDVQSPAIIPGQESNSPSTPFKNSAKFPSPPPPCSRHALFASRRFESAIQIPRRTFSSSLTHLASQVSLAELDSDFEIVDCGIFKNRRSSLTSAPIQQQLQQPDLVKEKAVDVFSSTQTLNDVVEGVKT
ncbi:UNVERIFIED_CONTAM: hypothetical protein HDU68_003086 [Siphonaria sp. JEL0065]|nr:hypothetical protein HDU68_003086 [Siphonaria sp. JEL0065]